MGDETTFATDYKARISQLRDLVRRAARGEDHGFKMSGDDEVGQLAREFRELLEDAGRPDPSLTRNLKSLSSALHDVNTMIQQSATHADTASSKAQNVSKNSEQVHMSIQQVVASSDAMQSSIREIAESAGNAARVASNAVSRANETNQTISKLGDSSGEIGKVIKVITSIAQQTNLLALNATIEAARAGEAGKGFAVVANEVKELAKETAKATEDISTKIEAIQRDTDDAVSAIGEIGEIIRQISDLQATIASAVEEQSVTTSEITYTLTEAESGAAGIVMSVTEMIDVSKRCAGDCEKVRGATDRMLAAALEIQMQIDPSV